MSEHQKRILANKSSMMTKSDYERRAVKIIQQTNCPLVTVFVSSGAPSTENCYICNTYERLPQIPVILASPDCPSKGIIKDCEVLKKLYKHKFLDMFLTVRKIQCERNLFRISVEKEMAFREFDSTIL